MVCWGVGRCDEVWVNEKLFIFVGSHQTLHQHWYILYIQGTLMERGRGRIWICALHAFSMDCPGYADCADCPGFECYSVFAGLKRESSVWLWLLGGGRLFLPFPLWCNSLGDCDAGPGKRLEHDVRDIQIYLKNNESSDKSHCLACVHGRKLDFIWSNPQFYLISPHVTRDESWWLKWD